MANDLVPGERLQQYAGIVAASAPLPGVRTDAANHAGAGGIGDLRQFRLSRRESQEKFWGRFGVTQSSGSRFETGLSIPAPVAILLKLYASGKLSDGDLQG